MIMENGKKQFLTIDIKYKKSIPLLDFKNSLDYWKNQYNKRLEQFKIYANK